MPLPELDDPLPFYQTVWLIVQQIPRGQVATYGQIAKLIPTPPGVDPDDYAAFGGQLVGFAMNAVSSRDDAAIPWHRVINGRGGISMKETNPAAAVQRGRLRAEGIEFNAKDLVDLTRYGWEGPDAGWLEEHMLNRWAPKEVPKADDEDEPPPIQLSLF